MSSEPVDEFTSIMEAAGFTVKDSGAIDDTEVIEYTGVTVSYAAEDGYPISVRVEYPVGRAMDAARALVLAGRADAIKALLAGAASFDDASVHGYFDANGINAAKYIEDTFEEVGSEAPPLSDADEFFTL